MTHSVTLLAVSWRYRRGKCQQPCTGLEKGKTTRGVFVLCLNSATGGGGRRREERRGGRRPEEVGIRQKKLLAAAQPEASSARRFLSSPRHPPPALACHYFTSRAVSQAHICTVTPPHTVCAALICSRVLPGSDPQNMANLNRMGKEKKHRLGKKGMHFFFFFLLKYCWILEGWYVMNQLLIPTS